MYFNNQVMSAFGNFTTTESAKEYKLIGIYGVSVDEGIKQIEITADENGDEFECSSFFIYAKIPAAAGNQLYVGAEMTKWMFFSGVGMSATAEKTLAMEMHHTGGGWWRGSMLAQDNVASDFVATNGSNLFANYRGNVTIGEKAKRLILYAGNGMFPNGATFEIYGK